MIKIIVILIIVGIPLGIVGAIYISIKSSISRREIDEQMNSNPEAVLQIAVKTMEDDIFTADEYEEQLIKIAESTGYTGAMLKLAELYAGEKGESKKDKEKWMLWRKRAAKAGDLTSIIEYYGFSDYDVSSSAYDEIIHDLDNAKAAKEGVSYLKGIVYFKKGLTEQAKQLFLGLSSSELEQQRQYMLFQCFMKESNITAAEKMLAYLEEGDFEIPAAAYLNLYNYYAARRDSTGPDYQAEMKYVERYAASEGADHETTCRIGGNTYYNAALAMEKGKYSFEKDTGKALEAYKKAADFGNAEALYYVGMSFWTGEYRDYYKANKYLLEAAGKNHQQAEAILEQYGVDGILIAPMSADGRVYHFMDGYELAASGSTVKWLSLLYGAQCMAVLLSNEFLNKYKETFKSFQELVNGVHQLYADQAAKMIRWGIHLLMSLGIDAYDAEDIINASEDLALLPRVPLFEQALEQIDDRAEQLNMKTAYAQATRRSWSGAGFGTTIGGTIRAAMGASVAAGAMNIGSGILHGIGDSIAESMNNSEIKGMGKKVFENPKTIKEFEDAVLSACLDIGIVLIKMIETHCDIELEALEGAVKFRDENLADIDERALNAKINNNLSVANNDYAYALLLEKLRRYPLDGDVLEQIIALTVRRSSYGSPECKEVLRYACDFKLEGHETELYASVNAVK